MSIYGCHNKPRPVEGKPIPVHDGYYQSRLTNTRYDKLVTVPYIMSTACQYTQQHPTDHHCAGCQHQKGK